MKTILSAMFLIAATAVAAHADKITVEMYLVSDAGVGERIGTVTVEDTKYGALFTPQLTKLPPGMHGFHVHEHDKCDCADKDGKMTAAQSAGGHYDPDSEKHHLGPYNDDGHRGDLPSLFVASDGTATVPVLAPRLKVKDLDDRALMIHANGDNFSDQPENGGGGPRIACGAID
jgi:Cu-Zn family superoxide dismutase